MRLCRAGIPGGHCLDWSPAMIRPTLVLVLLFVLPAGASAADSRAVPASAQQVLLSYAPVVRKAAPAVVNVYTRAVGDVGAAADVRRDPAYRRYFAPGADRLGHSLGSGVIVDPNGTIVTNQHVIQDAGAIVIVLSDRREFDAELVRGDDRTDLAVLKINTSGEALPFLTIKDTDDLEVGDIVLAIGNPFGVGQTVTSGIVSALGRSGLGIEGFEDFIQTDAPINPGNSGGALVDLKGRLIGINTAILAPAGGNVGVGFAVPINMAKSIMEQLLRYGTVEHGRIGIGGQDMTSEIARGLGTTRTEGGVVTTIEPGSPADRAGLKTGDIVVAVDHVPVRNWIAVVNRIALARVDQDITVTVERHGTLNDLHVTVAATPVKQRQTRGGQDYQ